MAKKRKRFWKKTSAKGPTFWLTRKACELLVDVWFVPLKWIYTTVRALLQKLWASKTTLKSGDDLPVHESDRRRHTCLIGATGTGKSETVKALVHHYLRSRQKAALVVIDPHGKLAQEIARFRENKVGNRLVYVKPDLLEDGAPSLNPLELRDRGSRAITVQTEEMISVFRELLDTGTAAQKFSTQTEALLYPCIYTLIKMGDRTLQDLIRFKDPKSSAPYVLYAKKHLKNPAHKDFFDRLFPEKAYDRTRLSVSTKLQTIFHSLPVARFLNNPSTIDLECALEDGRLIVFDFGDLGDLSRETLGRFIVAQLQSYARRRPLNSTPIHLFIDEAHQFISPSLGRILKEARKFGLHATLVQQSYGESMTPAMKDIVSGNTAVKITGMNSEKSLKSFSENTGTAMPVLKSLRQHEYLIKSGDKPPRKFKISGRTIGHRNSMSIAEWKAVLSQQLQQFYRILT
ncbi:MAG: DUF87 domain-containing protein [Pseudomonadota bacterium]